MEDKFDLVNNIKDGDFKYDLLDMAVLMHCRADSGEEHCRSCVYWTTDNNNCTRVLEMLDSNDTEELNECISKILMMIYKTDTTSASKCFEVMNKIKRGELNDK